MSLRRTLDPIAILEEEARAVANCFGIANSKDAAAALVDRMIDRLGGTHVYFPLGEARQREARRQHVKAAIRARFDGTNLRELAQDYLLSPRHVRRLLK
jgi:Mor family transcriptional regulator